MSHNPTSSHPRKELTGFRLVWHRLFRSKSAVVSMGLLLAIYGSALLAEWVAPYHRMTRFIDRVHVPPQAPRLIAQGKIHWPFIYDVKPVLSADGLTRTYVEDQGRRHPIRLFVRGERYKLFGLIHCDLHLFGADGTRWFPLGADRMGRDIFSQIIFGSRVSLTVGLAGVFLSLVIGTLFGALSGYYGGWIDVLMQRIIELLLVFPTIPLWLALAAGLPPSWGELQIYFGIVTILSLVGWGGLARQIRGMVLSIRERDYVKAARAYNCSDLRIVCRHVIPACTGHLVVMATLAIPGMILGETTLSFLGLGIHPPMTSWGVMLAEAQQIHVILQYPWVLIPTLPVILTVIAFNMFGDSLRGALDPHGK